MKRALALTLLGALFLPLLGAQTPEKTALVVEFGHKMFYAQPGVTAAYSLDPGVAQASAVAGGYQILGTAPGQTHVIVVGIHGARSILITVAAPNNASAAAASQSSPGETSSFGQFLVSYNNNPNQITNVSDLTQIAGDRQIHIQITNANIFPAQGVTPVGFPILSYDIARPSVDVTLLDKMVNNSDLTMDGVLLRGLHLTIGKWEFHGGITSITQFQDFLLPGNRYEVGGISRHFTLGSRSDLEANLYYIDTNTQLNPGATTGPIGTLRYHYSNPSKLTFKAEVGVGNGLGFAGAIDWSGKNQELHGDLRYESPNIATLGINQLHGTVTDFSWAARDSKRFTTQVTANDTSINIPTERQKIGSVNLNQTFWLTSHFGLMGGYIVSNFSSQTPASFSVFSHGITAGPELRWKHFGGSYQYQNLQNNNNTPSSSNQAINLQGAIRKVSISAFYDEQTETPVFAPVQSSNPSLQELLRHASAQAISAKQMSAFLRQDSSLLSRGVVQPVAIGLATRRAQDGVTVNWAGNRAGRFSINGLVNTSTGGTVAGMHLLSGGVTWTRQLGSTNLVNAGYSFFRTTSGGQSTTEPVIQVSMQHQLFSVPRWLAPGRRGVIEGHAFVDSQFTQTFAPSDPPLAGVLVRLDRHRTTRTDKNGYYRFRGVPFGAHEVEIQYHDTRPFFYTTSSPKQVAINDSADFGISFARGRLFGAVENDAGSGLPVTVSVSGSGIKRDIETQTDGQFSLEGLPDGDYTVHLVDASVPSGYFVGALQDSVVHVSAAHAGKIKIVLPAQRSIAGKVEIYDPVAGDTVPLANARVRLTSSGEVSTTDSMGRFLFRHLPPGAWTVAFDYDGRHFEQAVSLASTPDIETGINFTIPLRNIASRPEPAAPVSAFGAADQSDLQNRNGLNQPKPKKR